MIEIGTLVNVYECKSKFGNIRPDKIFTASHILSRERYQFIIIITVLYHLSHFNRIHSKRVDIERYFSIDNSVHKIYGSCHFQTGLMHENGVLNTYQIYQLSVLFLFTLH